MAPWLTAVSTLGESPGLVPSTQMKARGHQMCDTWSNPFIFSMPSSSYKQEDNSSYCQRQDFEFPREQLVHCVYTTLIQKIN